MPGCLQIIIDWRTCGAERPRERAMVEGEEVGEVRREAKGGERVCRECPILLMARCLGYWRVPVESNASGGVRGVVWKMGWDGGRAQRGKYVWVIAEGLGESELTLFEEETDFIAALQEIIIAHVLHALTLSSREAGHGVVLDGEVLEEAVRLCKESGYSLGVKGVGDDEVAIDVEGFDLGGREAWRGGHDNGGVRVVVVAFYSVRLVSIRT